MPLCLHKPVIRRGCYTPVNVYDLDHADASDNDVITDSCPMIDWKNLGLLIEDDEMPWNSMNSGLLAR